MTELDTMAFLVAVVNRGGGEKLAARLGGQGVSFMLLGLGRGTAPQSVRSYLGLGAEREILYAVTDIPNALRLLGMLGQDCRLYLPGRGIAFCVPIAGVADRASKRRLLGESEEKGMECNFAHELIVAVVNHGYAEEVMEMARTAGATGGTILHARGAGGHAEKFFGISVQPEKELLLIVAAAQDSAAVMRVIAQQKGSHTDANAIAFALPVAGVAGLSDG